MREIKFRAWHEEASEMLEWHEGLEIYNDGVRFVDEEGAVGDASSFPLMQYTGLKDKNGKEIYEGDIVGDDIAYDEIVFKDGAFDFRQPMRPRHNLSELVIDSKIISNVYENPELLANQ